MRTDRQKAIMAAVEPYIDVANFNVPDVWAAAEKSVADVAPEEISDAFLALAEDAESDIEDIEAELKRRAAHEKG